MYKVEEDGLFSVFENKLDTLENLIDQQISFMQAQASMSQQAFDFEEAHYFNYNGGYFFQPNNNEPNYHHSSWRTYEDFSYWNSRFRKKG